MQNIGFVDDSDLGRIILRSNKRARRFTFRCTEEGLCCTVPARLRQSDLLRAIEELRPRLKAMMLRFKERQADRYRLTPQEVELLRKQAKEQLPSRLQVLASARGLSFQKVSIHKSRTRWGSCSSKGTISLSLYLMLLPPHLQDYVMQHELTHLLEMNHSSRFWNLLDGVTDGKALAYRKEMRNFHLPIL
jgi:predicted metal-dependent hydrolase